MTFTFGLKGKNWTSKEQCVIDFNILYLANCAR